VCINTLISLMFCFVKWAPNCFEMKHVEVRIFVKLVDHFNWNLRIGMSKRTDITVFTFSSS
jgi:hypothetical protein